METLDEPPPSRAYDWAQWNDGAWKFGTLAKDWPEFGSLDEVITSAKNWAARRTGVQFRRRKIHGGLSFHFHANPNATTPVARHRRPDPFLPEFRKTLAEAKHADDVLRAAVAYARPLILEAYADNVQMRDAALGVCHLLDPDRDPEDPRDQ